MHVFRSTVFSTDTEKNVNLSLDDQLLFMMFRSLASSCCVGLIGLLSLQRRQSHFSFIGASLRPTHACEPTQWDRHIHHTQSLVHIRLVGKDSIVAFHL